MRFEDLTPDHVDGANIEDLKALGLPPEVFDSILENGLSFKWDAASGRYIPFIPKRRARSKK